MLKFGGSWGGCSRKASKSLSRFWSPLQESGLTMAYEYLFRPEWVRRPIPGSLLLSKECPDPGLGGHGRLLVCKTCSGCSFFYVSFPCLHCTGLNLSRLPCVVVPKGKVSCSVSDISGFGFSGMIDYGRGDYKQLVQVSLPCMCQKSPHAITCKTQVRHADARAARAGWRPATPVIFARNFAPP